MADATVFPTLAQLTYFQWATVAAPNPRLAAPIGNTNTDTTLTFTSAPLDKAGVVVTEAFLMGVKNDEGYVETIYVPAGGLSSDGLTATGVTRGIELEGIDFRVGDDSNIGSFDGDDPVFCNITAVLNQLMVSTLQGAIATGGTGIIVGTDAAGTITFSRSTGVGTAVGFLRWFTTNSKAQFSNDGVVWTNFDSVSASNLVVVSGDDNTPGNVEAKFVAGTNTTIATNNPGANETFQYNALGLLASIVTDVTTTAAEINTALDGISANVTAANLSTLVDGGSADALHSHENPSKSFIALEAVTADDSLALMANEVEFFAQLTEAFVALGDANARRRYSITFVPTKAPTGTTWVIRGREVGSSVLNLQMTIETDTAGDPSGTAVTNGTAASIDTSSWTTTSADRTITFPGIPTLTIGVTYHFVFEVDATDGANHIEIGGNSSHDEDFVTFTRQTFDLDAATWGNAVTNATPFFWSSGTERDFGLGVVPTDANFGGRTWPFEGFAVTSVSANAAVEVYFDIAKDLSLDAGAEYWLSTTAGQITTTKPNGLFGQNFAFKIGRAISETELQIDKGEKLIRISQASITATTATDFVLWFRPNEIEVDAVGGATSNTASHSRGFFDGTNNNSVSAAEQNGSTSSVSSSASNSGFVSDSSGGSSMTGVGSAVTDVGFTYTWTEAGTALVLAQFKCTA